MNFSELSDIWNSQSFDVDFVDKNSLMEALHDEHQREEAKLRKINIQEVVPAVGLFLFFGTFGFFVETGAWAFFAVAFLCLGIGAFLIGSTIQQRMGEAMFGDSVKEQLQKTLSQHRHRAWLYGNLLWWYLLPGVLGWYAVVHVTMLQDGLSAFEIGYIVVAVVFFVWVYFANRRVATNQYQPRCGHLEEILSRFESDKNGDQS